MVMKVPLRSHLGTPFFLTLYQNGDNVPVVVADSYYEPVSDYQSCSYVAEPNAATTNDIGGLESCIVYVAEEELEYTEAADGYTKFGDWFNRLYGEQIG